MIGSCHIEVASSWVMGVISLVAVEPWSRPRKERVDLPSTLDVDELEDLDDDAYAALLADNLLPRSEAARRDWSIFWALVYDEPALRDRADALLSDLLERAEIARTAAETDPAADPARVKKISKFAHTTRGALDRVRALTPAITLGALLEAVEEHRQTLVTAGHQPLPTDLDLYRQAARPRVTAKQLENAARAHRRALHTTPGLNPDRRRIDRRLWAIHRVLDRMDEKSR